MISWVSDLMVLEIEQIIVDRRPRGITLKQPDRYLYRPATIISFLNGSAGYRTDSEGFQEVQDGEYLYKGINICVIPKQKQGTHIS